MVLSAGLEPQAFDVAVIGGGMAGAGIARDAAMRGLSTVLLERRDFAYGTTSKSSKLIHGGLRYLELFDFALVRESLVERSRLERLAPHLVRPLPFLVPVYRGAKRGMILVRIGLRLYDLLTPGKTTGRYRGISAEEALALEPTLSGKGLEGAGYYFDDLLLFPERLCLENVLSARRAGAAVANYAEVEAMRRDAAGWTLEVRDALTGEGRRLAARVVVNASGPWVDRVRKVAGASEAGDRVLRLTKGIHVAVPRLTDRAIYLESEKDGRMFFVIPWREFSWVGTTDTDYTGDLDRIVATRQEVDYLLASLERALPGRGVTADSVSYAWAGVRPLTFEAGRRESAVSREHRIVSEADGSLLSVTGTKLTTYRSLAEEAAGRVARILGRPSRSRTARVALDGADTEGHAVEARLWLDVSAESARTGLPTRTLERLVETYGRRAAAVLDLAAAEPGLAAPLCPSSPEIAAQVVVACRDEMARTLTDVMLRRTAVGQGACLGRDCAPRVARLMAGLLGWDERRIAREVEAYAAVVADTVAFREAPAPAGARA